MQEPIVITNIYDFISGDWRCPRDAEPVSDDLNLRPPPETKPACIMPHSQTLVQHDPIDAIVTAAQQIPVETDQTADHADNSTSALLSTSTAPKGPLFRSPVCEKV
jgi:hypothetical protein